MPRRIASSGPSRYKKLARGATGDEFLNSQFERPPPKIPYKAIILAVVLFFFGSVMIIIGSLLLTGYIYVEYSDRTWAVLILGVLMFIPGAYHVRIAYYAYKGYEGFSYDDIPEYD